jgi:hypothetical protein
MGKMIMKRSSNFEFFASCASATSFRSLSGCDLIELLPQFYLGLDFDARRARFGAAVSNESIIRHCRGLDLNQALVLGCAGSTGLVAVVELHPMSPVWEDAELALSDQAATDRIMILGHLLQLVALDLFDGDLLRLLRGMGRVRLRGDSAHVDISEYARLHGLSSGRV